MAGERESIVQNAAERYADRIRERGLNICNDIYYDETKAHKIFLVLNSPRDERTPGSGTPQESEFLDLMAIRAEIVGGLEEDDPLVRALYSSRYLSLPDAGHEVVEGLTMGYKRIRIKPDVE